MGVLTTQAATKVYHARAGRPAEQAVQAEVEGDGVLLAWPDPVACFADADYRQRQVFALSGDASLAWMECVTCGRLAFGERWEFARYDSRTEVVVDGRTVVIDALCLDREEAAIDSSMRTGEFNAYATVGLVGSKLREAGEAIAQAVEQESLPRADDDVVSAVSRLEGGVMVLRAAGRTTQGVLGYVQHVVRPMVEGLGVCPWDRKW